MGLFKDKALGKAHKCSVCGKTLYEIADKSMESSLRLMKKGYRWDTISQCQGCGSCTCESCRMVRLMCKCGCGRSLAIPAARK